MENFRILLHNQKTNVNQFKKQYYKMVMTPYVSKTYDLKDRPILAGPISPMQVLHSLIEKILK